MFMLQIGFAADRCAEHSAIPRERNDMFKPNRQAVRRQTETDFDLPFDCHQLTAPEPWCEDVLLYASGTFRVETVVVTPAIGEPGSLREQLDRCCLSRDSNPVILKFPTLTSGIDGFTAEPAR